MQKFFAKCDFDCGFISRKISEEISLEKFSKMKESLSPESLSQFVRIEGEADSIESIPKTVSVAQAVKKNKKVYVK